FVADDGKALFVANRGGSVATIDLARRETIAETGIGRQLADLAATPDGRHLLAVDEGANEVIVLVRHGTALEMVERIPVSPAPVSVQVAPDGSRCFVASLWS